MCGTQQIITENRFETWVRIPLSTFLACVFRELCQRAKWALGWRPRPVRLPKEVS